MEDLRTEFKQNLDQLAVKHVELKDENRGYALRSEQTLKRKPGSENKPTRKIRIK